jgi:hypothetical protein
MLPIGSWSATIAQYAIVLCAVTHRGSYRIRLPTVVVEVQGS